jgi:acyl-coenzyme A thioesterase PaaI-like protein
MKPAASKAELQRLLDSERFLQPWKFRLVKVGDGECTVALPNSPSLERPGGIVNGPALIAAADVAMWLAIKAHLGMAHDALTSDLNTVFLAPAKPGPCIARRASSRRAASASSAPPTAATARARSSRTTP